MKPGIRVVRGPDWLLGNQDGGPGFLGTVVKLFPDNRVLVRWDIGTETECRAGKDGAFDLRIYNNAPIGVRFRWITCDSCRRSKLPGFRWKCLVCRDKDLCTECYMKDQCEPHHPHVRFITYHSMVVRVGPRRRCKAIPLYGIFPGAEVATIAHGTGDSEKKIGIVSELVDLEPDGYQGAVKVEWRSAADSEGEASKPDVHTYRIGAEGKVELKLVKPVANGSVYLDHLPLLDLTMPVDVEFNEGDRVRVDLHLDTFRPLMKEYGGWVDELERALGEEGKIKQILDQNRRLVRVDFNKMGKSYVLYMNLLTKIDKISAGDIVKVIDNEDKMKRLQVGHAGWQNANRSILGEVGRVIRIDDSQDAIVQINKRTYILNPSTLVWLEKGQDSTEDDRKGVTVGVGMRVVRGPGWSPDFGDQDGGEGHLGSVVEICGLLDNSMYPKQCVVVQWDSGDKNVYRAGYEKAYDLRVYDSAGLGVVHNQPCSECKVEKVFGVRWQCSECPEISLCSECYAGDMHDIQHPFIRFDTVDDKTGHRMPKRGVSRKLKARGIFEKSRVQRGPDWRWHNQDGGEDKTGEVIALVNFSPDTDRDAAEVTWENGYTNVYRLGYKGRLDVKCVAPEVGGCYYVDHIAVLKLDTELANAGVEPPVSGAEGTTPAPSGGEEAEGRFKEGDKVKIEIEPELLKAVEQNRGAWSEQMTECIGQTGRVIMSKGVDITVDFDSAGKWTFHESVLNKLKEFVPGQSVRVQDSVANVKMLQSGDWNDLMVEVCGKRGKVEEIDEDGDVKVSFDGGVCWVFNAECLVMDDGKSSADAPKPVQDLPPRGPKSDEEKLQDLFQAIFSGDVEKVNSILRTDPQLVLMDLQGKFAIHLACREGKIDVVETLFKNSSKEVLLELPDPEKNTPLLAAVKGEKSEMVKFLVEQGANKDAADQSDRTAVHMAATSNNVAMLGLLQALQFDINKKDMLNQSAIFDAIVSDNEEIIAVVLSWPEVEVRYQDSIGFTPFSIACRRGNLDAVRRILKIAPDELNNPKQDGCTGLHMAALNNHKAVVDFLLQQDGIAIDAVNKGENHTPLHIACHEGYLDIVKLLIEKGANKMAVDCSRKTPLHLCCEVSPEKVNEPEKSDANVLKMVEYLLKSGVPYNLKDKADKVAEDYIKPSAKKAFQELVAKWGQERDAEVSDPPRDNAASSGNDLMTGSVNLPRNPTPEPAKMSQSTGAPRRTMEPTPRITDMQEKGPKDAEADKDPELCESCEEEPVRYKMEPCGCYLCAECIPRKKAKKKSCAMCAEAVAEVTELR